MSRQISGRCSIGKKVVVSSKRVATVRHRVTRSPPLACDAEKVACDGFCLVTLVLPIGLSRQRDDAVVDLRIDRRGDEAVEHRRTNRIVRSKRSESAFLPTPSRTPKTDTCFNPRL